MLDGLSVENTPGIGAAELSLRVAKLFGFVTLVREDAGVPFYPMVLAEWIFQMSGISAFIEAAEERHNNQYADQSIFS